MLFPTPMLLSPLSFYMISVLRPRLNRAGSLLCCAIALLVVTAQAAPDQELPAVLNSAQQVRQLPRPQAAAGTLPVKFRAVATYINREARFGVVQDDTAGITVAWTNASSPIEIGQEIEVVGAADFYRHEPGIALQDARVLGPGDLPKPVRPISGDLFSGRSDCQWTEIEGTVRAASTNRNSLLLEMTVNRKRLPVSICDASESNPARWIDSRLRIRGVARCTFNAKDQIIGAEFLVPRTNDIQVLERPRTDPYSLPVTHLSALGRNFENNPGDRVHIRGIVTLFLPGQSVFLREETESIQVRTSQRAGIAPGDTLDVIGFFERTESSLYISDANFRPIAHGASVEPIRAKISQLTSGQLNAELVTVNAEILEWRHGLEERTATLRSGGEVFNARLDNSAAVEEWPAGTLVRITGVCLARIDQNRSDSPFDLRLRSVSDLERISSPPWLTREHVIWLASGLLLLGIMALAWAGVLTRSNRQLERRVTQRTQAFETENAERRRAETALRESQALYLSLVEHLPMAIYRKDAKGKYLFANSGFAKIRGLPIEEIVGRTLFDLLPREQAEVYSSEDEVVLETGQPLELDRKAPLADGKVLHLHVLKTPVFNAAGEIVGTQGMMIDVTDRALAESELDSERDLLRTLLDSSSDHIYFKDLDSRFIKCSRRLAERFGLAHMDDVVGKTDFNFFDVAHARAAFADEQEIIGTGRPIVGKVEKESWRGDGKVTWALTSKLPLRNKAGAIVGTFGISKDITDIKEAESKLESVHQQLLETSRRAGMAEVATSVLHNVGNVLNSVTTSAGVLADHLRNSKINGVARVHGLLSSQSDLPAFFAREDRATQLLDYLGTLRDHLAEEQSLLLKELQDLGRNIDHIKEIVAMQQSYARVAGVLEKLPPASLVNDALRMHAGALARHQVRTVRFFQDVPEIQIDKHKTIQILINLISNAKYALSAAPVEDKVLTVRIESCGPECIRIQVQDNGIGVSSENLTRIFSHGFTTRTEGHGFGLHAGALAAKEMGGRLSVHSDGPGKGAIFTLELPLQPPEHPSTGSTEGTILASTASVETVPATIEAVAVPV